MVSGLRALTASLTLATLLSSSASSMGSQPVDAAATLTTVSRHELESGLRVVVGIDRTVPIVAICAAPLDGGDDLLAETRGGRAESVEVFGRPIRCARYPSGELEFAVWRVARLLRSDHADIPSDDDAAERARARLARLATQGTLPVERSGPTVVTVVGNVDAEDVLRVARAHLVGRTGPSSARVAPRRPARQSSERLAVLEDDRVATPVVHYGWTFDRSSLETRRALAVAAAILLGGDRARLPWDLVRRRRLARSVSAWWTDADGIGVLGLSMQLTERASIDKAQRFVDGALKQLRIVGPSEREMQRALRQLEVRALLALEHPVVRAAWLTEYERQVGDATRLAADLRAIAETSAEQVRQAAKAHLVPTRRTSVEVYPVDWQKDDPSLEGYRLHTVELGDTLETLARRFGVRAATIARENDHDPKHRLSPGQALWIPPAGSSSAP